MNLNENLVKIQMIKVHAIKKYTAIPYMLSKDYDELFSWPKERADKIIKVMIDYHSIFPIEDASCCPWCIDRKIKNMSEATIIGNTETTVITLGWYERLYCLNCNYGKRHKMCGVENSDYKETLLAILSSITELPRVKKKIRKILKEYKLNHKNN